MAIFAGVDPDYESSEIIVCDIAYAAVILWIYNL